MGRRIFFCWRLLGLIPGGTPFSQLISGSQISADEKRCCNILGRLQKKEDAYLHLVFHDTMISRVQMSGLGLAACCRLIFRSWKSYVEEMKISKLRLDVRVQNFCNFLAHLSEGEKKIVFPLIRETQQKIDDCRTRKKNSVLFSAIFLKNLH